MLEMDVKLNLNDFRLSVSIAVDTPITAILGPDGAGKSTVLGMIAGTIYPQRGWIRLAGKTLFDAGKGIRVPPARRPVALIRPDSSIYPFLTARSFFNDASRKTEPSDSRFQLASIIKLMEIEPLLDTHYHELSRFEKQRIAVGHALLGNPSLLLLDQIHDEQGNETLTQMMPYLHGIRDNLQIRVIYACNTLDSILHPKAPLVLMADGRVLGSGDAESVLADRLLQSPASLQGIENILPVTILEHEPQLGCTMAYYFGIPIVLPLADQLPVTTEIQVAVRSNDISLSRRYLDGVSIQNQIKGRIGAIIENARHAIVQIDCGTTLLAAISLKGLLEMKLQEGDTIYCLIKTHAFSYVSDKPLVFELNPDRDETNHNGEEGRATISPGTSVTRH